MNHELQDQTVIDDIDTEDEFSLVDPLLWAPLLLVGVGLVAFPEPATTLLGLICIAAGVVVAVVDFLSPSDSAG